MDDNARQVRDGLFLASSRSYGEQYVEPFIRYKYHLNKAENGAYDGVGADGKKYEIKSCKVLRSTGNREGQRTILKRVLFENTNATTNRLVPFAKSTTASYMANVQNVKRDHFDILLYVLLFEDCIKIFSVNKEDIHLEHVPHWSDYHGRYDAPGKSGQFPITKTSIDWHVEHHLLDTVTYQEMREAFEELS